MNCVNVCTSFTKYFIFYLICEGIFMDKSTNVVDDNLRETESSVKVKNKLPNLTKVQMFMMTFGYFGTQVAFSMQTGSMGRIFQTIGEKYVPYYRFASKMR